MTAAKDLAPRQDARPWRPALHAAWPWPAELGQIDATFGGDPWPYGVEANRPTLEALVRYTGGGRSLIKAPIPIDELFVPV